MGDLGVRGLVGWLGRTRPEGLCVGGDGPSMGDTSVAGVLIGRAEGAAEGGIFHPASTEVVAVFKLSPWRLLGSAEYALS